MNQLISEVQQFDKYAKWLPEEGRRETWAESVTRVIDYFKANIKQVKAGDPIWAQLYEAILAKDVMPSMRVMQMAGPALDRCHVGAYNCAYLPLDGPKALGELLYIMMQGTGVGFSVERQYTDLWPTVKESSGEVQHIKVIDTTEGWCDAFVHTIEAAFQGIQVDWDYSLIRPEGARLLTKGGTASGPAPLKSLLNKTYEIIKRAIGRKLRPFEIHRLATLAGSIVQVGGVRRAAQISLSDLDDHEMRDCKKGAFWNKYPELAMANNSAVYVIPPGPIQFHKEWTALKESGTGERGIFNRAYATAGTTRRTQAGIDHPLWGTNPCGEIVLRPRQFCNLSIAVARPHDTVESLKEKVRLATILGTFQSTLTDFNYLPADWAVNCKEERLLGVDITGAMDCPLLNDITPKTAYILLDLKREAIAENAAWAAKLKINQSVAVTCNKPSGNSSQLLDCSSGIHPRFAPFYIRRIQIAADSPLAKRLNAMNIPSHPISDAFGFGMTRSYEFVAKSPASAIVRRDLTALLQFKYWMMWKSYWCEHNPSTTIYIDHDEWDRMEQEILANWTLVGGLAFLPLDNHVYQNAPYEEIDEAEFLDRSSIVKDQHLGIIHEEIDTTTASQEWSCVGEKCEWK